MTIFNYPFGKDDATIHIRQKKWNSLNLSVYMNLYWNHYLPSVCLAEICKIEAKSNEKQLHTNLHSLLIETNRAKSTRWGNTPNAIYFKCLSLLVCQNWMRYICFIQHRMGWKQISFGASSIYKYTSVHPEVFAAALSQNKKMKSWLYFI